MSVPAHKVVGDKSKPGQWVNPDVTLGDYLARKKRYDALDTVKLDNINKVKTECCGNPLRGCVDCPPPKKLTFEEWKSSAHSWGSIPDGYDDAFYFCWKAAQENV